MDKTKKKKYWLIPVCIFILLVIFLFIVIYPIITGQDEYAFSSFRIISIFMVGLCGIGLIPSVAIAIYLSSKDKK